MTATRSRKEEIIYKKHLKSQPQGCPFCRIEKGSDQLVEETKYFKIIRNIFSYSLWDGQRVADHLMLVPKKHIASIADIPKAAATEFIEILGRYEKKSYNVYARAPASVIKSVVHQHTHLIKPMGRPKKFVLLLRKPFIRITN